MRHDVTLKLISVETKPVDRFASWLMVLQKTWQAKALEAERASLESFLQPLNSQLRDLDDQVGGQSARQLSHGRADGLYKIKLAIVIGLNSLPKIALRCFWH